MFSTRREAIVRGANHQHIECKISLKAERIDSCNDCVSEQKYRAIPLFIFLQSNTFLIQDTLFMFIEYMHYGALNHFIAKYRKCISEPVIAYILREVLRGLDAIHRRRQLHRDLKSDNILINRNG